MNSPHAQYAIQKMICCYFEYYFFTFSWFFFIQNPNWLWHAYSMTNAIFRNSIKNKCTFAVPGRENRWRRCALEAFWHTFHILCSRWWGRCQTTSLTFLTLQISVSSSLLFPLINTINGWNYCSHVYYTVWHRWYANWQIGYCKKLITIMNCSSFSCFLVEHPSVFCYLCCNMFKCVTAITSTITSF